MGKINFKSDVVFWNAKDRLLHGRLGQVLGVICDEATSALDVFVQADIVELLRNLKNELNLTSLFISHDLGLVQALCDETSVMYQGQIIEKGKVEDIIDHSWEEGTRNLMDSVQDI